MAMFTLPVVVLIVCVCYSYGLTFEENGYHMVVAIHGNITENPAIIEELQEALVSASEYLHRTTRNYFFIKTVTILVPETWATKPEWTSSLLTFSEADIRVDSPHPSMGNNPYTFQPGLCGDAGRYIHLTPDFVLDKMRNQNRVWDFGDFGRVLVHEFAHLRYGVFDEYGSKGSTQHPVSYLDGSTLRPTACSKEIKGHFTSMITETDCDPNDNDDKKLLADDCAFIVVTENNTATSSVMCAQYVKEVVHFCETITTDPKLRHNADAPNQQNKMCNGRGTWDIIREHDDVKKGLNRSVNTKPIFKVVQRLNETVNETQVCGRRFVFVLDVSASMKDNNRYFKLRQMADKIIRDILPVGTEVGIVTFSTTARVWAEMRYLKTESDRQTLAEGLPNVNDFNGLTAIGRGLLQGINLLERNGKTAEKGRIFLITDGSDNYNPTLKSRLGEIRRKNVVVHTLAYSNAAEDSLQKLSGMTVPPGFYSYYDESKTSTQLDSMQWLQLDLDLCNNPSIEVDRHAALLDSTITSFERTVLIDSTVGKNTLFVFTLSRTAKTGVSIKDPDENVYDDTSSYYKKDEILNIIRFRFPESKQGKWTYTLTRGSTNETVVGVVTSRPRNILTLPYEMETWLGETSIDLRSQTGLGIFSYIHKGYSPIVKAVVKGFIFSSALEKEITLLDDGKFPDNTADDGVYTGFVTGFRFTGRHFVDSIMKVIPGQTAIIRRGTSLSSKAPVIYPNGTDSVVLEPVEPFTRTSSAGAVDVEGFDENVDQFDPSRVTDLEVVISDRGSRQVTLTWTAPGDDLNEGTVDRYDVRIAESFEALRQNFSDSYEILDTDIKKGNNTPVPAGSQQTMTVSLPGHLDTDSYVFGLKAIDESNRTSDLSNLRAITFAKIITPGSKEDAAEKSQETTPPMILVVINTAVGFVVFIVVAIICSCVAFRKKATYKVSVAHNIPI